MNDHKSASQAGTGDAPPRGREQDYEWAVEAFYEPLYRFAHGLTRNGCDAEDLTHDTYRVLLTKGATIRDAGKMKGWLFTTLYRRFLGRRRRAVRFPQTTFEQMGWEPHADPDRADASVDAALAVEALHGMEEIYRAPLVLFYLEEFPYKEIAKVLGIPIGTVMSRLSRGKKILRRRLDGKPERASMPRSSGGRARLCCDMAVCGA